MSMVSERPWSNFILVSEIIFRYLDTHNAISTFAGHKIVSNLCSGLISSKFEVGRSDIDVHTYISGIGRGILRKNPAKIIANSIFFVEKMG